MTGTVSAGSTLACSTRSPADVPAWAKAATAATVSARVTACTATLQPASWAFSMVVAASSTSASSSRRTSFSVRSVTPGTSGSSGPAMALARTATDRMCSRSAAVFAGVVSVTPVMP